MLLLYAVNFALLLRFRYRATHFMNACALCVAASQVLATLLVLVVVVRGAWDANTATAVAFAIVLSGAVAMLDAMVSTGAWAASKFQELPRGGTNSTSSTSETAQSGGTTTDSHTSIDAPLLTAGYDAADGVGTPEHSDW
jgi:hypothetical protein